LRSSVSPEQLWYSCFLHIDKKDFIVAWKNLSSTLNIDQYKLRPSDRLIDLMKTYPFPEMFWEDLEGLFSKYGAEDKIKDFSEETHVKDVICAIINISRDD